MRSEREHACPPPSRPFNHRSTGALPLFLSVVAREKKQKEGEKNGRKKKRHMTNRTTSFISIQGADVDPDGYAEAAGNLKAQGKT
uniref:Uncharacterized protein n=1 Tax=Oryza rufipogon TaxID=4529 RepID=A0A0E0NX74_ORYRU